MSLTILPLDPLSRVTGSCTLVHEPTHDTRVLIDCGAYQGEYDSAVQNKAPFPFDPKSIHCVLLTHGHYDHCGRLVELYRQGFRGRVYGSRESIEIAKIVLLDSAKIKKDSGAKRIIERKIDWYPLQTLFEKKRRPIAQNLSVNTLRAGHIIGAVSFMLFHKEDGEWVNVIFSGDIGNNIKNREVQPLLARRMSPSYTQQIAVMEGTYGDRCRCPTDLDASARRAQLRELVLGGVERGGPVIIPVFAVQRMQDVLYDLHILMAEDPGFLKGIPVLVDGPMGGAVSEVLRDALKRDFASSNGKVRPLWMAKTACSDLGLDPANPDHLEVARDLWGRVYEKPEPFKPGAIVDAPRAVRQGGEALPSPASRFRVQRSGVLPKDRKRIMGSQGPKVVVASGGMCVGGPVRQWLAQNLDREECSVILTGFCTPGSLADRLLKLQNLASDQRALYQEALQVEGRTLRLCDIASSISSIAGYSGHADQAGLLDWAFPRDAEGKRRAVAERILITHGSDSARRGLRDALTATAVEEGLSVVVDLPAPECDGIDVGTGASVPREQVLGKEGGARPSPRDAYEALTRAQREALPEVLRRALE